MGSFTHIHLLLQFIPRLLEKLEGPISRGLFGTLKAGSCLLARHQNRLVLLRVLESGFMYRCVEAKGLELQETSCHSLEAATVSGGLDKRGGGEDDIEGEGVRG